jgi:hypothetical protein
MGDIRTSKPMISKGRFKQRIVICGSMSFYGDMLEIQNLLTKKGIPSIVPEPEDQYKADLFEEDFAIFKCKLSFQYLKKIRAPETVAILAVNSDKHAIPDYLGPNTFAEIAVAFAQKKRLFLLQGVPNEYVDELRAWGVIPLDGSLSGIFQYYKAATQPSVRQLEMFQDL